MTSFLRQVLEPVLPLPDAVTETDAETLRGDILADVARIESTDWSNHVEVALAESVRITADEAARRQGADTKSSTYLVVVAALIPIVAAIQVAVWEGKAGPAPRWASLGVAEIATAYVALSGFWALRALKVTIIDCVDVEDMLAAWRVADPRPELVKRMLAGARRTRPAIDLKLSRMLLAQDYLFRGFLMLVLLLLLNAAVYFVGLIHAVSREPGVAANPAAVRTIRIEAPTPAAATRSSRTLPPPPELHHTQFSRRRVGSCREAGRSVATATFAPLSR